VTTEGEGKEPAAESAAAFEAARNEDAAAEGGQELPAVDFATFVLSLNHSALVHLGLAPDPVTGQTEVNLPLARQTIDLVALLQEKTKGNLTGEEERIIEQILYELRLGYVETSKASKSK
jgi:hypothetical protein